MTTLVTLAELFPFLGPAGGLVVGLYIGVSLHRRFVAGAIADGDQAHQQAIATHRNLAEDAIAMHRKLTEDLAAEFAGYRERTAAEREAAATERGRLEERLSTIMHRLDECRSESHELVGRVAVLEAQQPTRVSVVETHPTGGD